MSVDSTLLPLFPPPESPSLPLNFANLSSRPPHIPESDPFAGATAKSNLRAVRGWKVKRHVFPAAFPRTKLNSSRPASKISESRKSAEKPPLSSPTATASSPDNKKPDKRSPTTDSFTALTTEQVKEKMNKLTNLLDQHAAEPWTDLDNPEHLNRQRLWIAVNHYVPPRPVPNGLTLIFNHGISFFKEIWEPLIAEMLCHSHCPPIADIWCLDNVLNGDSAVLNREILGTAYDTRDDARDYMQFLLRYLPSANQTHNDSLPVMLPCLKLGKIDLESIRTEHLFKAQHQKSPPTTHFRERKIFAIGHSMGAACAAFAVAGLPQVFSGAAFIDSVLLPTKYSIQEGLVYFLEGVLQRQVAWKNMESAIKSLKRNRAVYGRWQDDVLNRFLHFGLMPLPGYPAAVTLKTAKKEEQLAYADGIVSHRGFQRLKDVSSNIKVHWIYPEGGSPVRPLAHKYCNNEVSHSTMSVIKKKGHLLPMDFPREVAWELVGALNKSQLGITSFHDKSKL